MKRFALLASLMILGALLVPGSAQAHHPGSEDPAHFGTNALFTIFCNASHRNNDDPIKFPGQQGASHTHQYVGSTVMDYNVTEAEARNGPTTCKHKSDTAGYWWPAVVTNPGGAPVDPQTDNQFFYYYCQPVGLSCQVDRAAPAGLKLIFGTSVGDTLNNTGAGGSFSPTGGFNCNGKFYNRMVNCGASGVKFDLTPPNCLGVDASGAPLLDSVDHRSHMAYHVNGVCPNIGGRPSIKVQMPTYFVNYPNACTGPVTTPITYCTTHKLSSDGGANPGSTLHADFYNTWNQADLDRITTATGINHQDVPESVQDSGGRLLSYKGHAWGAWSAQTGTVNHGLATNGGFETGNLTGWTTSPAGAVTVTTDAKNTGTYGARVLFDKDVTGSRSISRTFSVSPNETLCFSANIYTHGVEHYANGGSTGSEYEQYDPRIQIRNAGSPFQFLPNPGSPRNGGTAISPSVSGMNGGGIGPREFKYVYTEAVVPASGVTSVTVSFSAPNTTQTDAQGNPIIWVDDLSFAKSTCSDPAGSPPPPQNAPPTVSAGSDATITLPNSVSLNGTVTDDGLPNPPGTTTSTWSKVSGPGTVTFGNANAVDTTASFSVDGTYVLQLMASDSALSNSDNVQVTVNPAGGGETTVTIYGSTSDGELRFDGGSGLSYAQAREGQGTPVVNTTAIGMNEGGLGYYSSIGQWCNGTNCGAGSNFYAYDYFAFDTSSIPDGATITNVEVKLYCRVHPSVPTDSCDVVETVTHDAEIRLKDWGTTLDAGDFVPGSQLANQTLLAKITSAPGSRFPSNAYINFVSEPAFAGAVNKTGFTRVMLSTSRQRLGSVPSDDETFHPLMADADGTGTSRDPKLIITYFL